jgi:hypothetical protein
MVLAFACILLVMAIGSTSAQANTAMDLFKNSGIRVGGWLNGGATFNPGQTTGFNGPVTFGDQANRAQLNQFNIFVQRAVVA